MQAEGLGRGLGRRGWTGGSRQHFTEQSDALGWSMASTSLSKITQGPVKEGLETAFVGGRDVVVVAWIGLAS